MPRDRHEKNLVISGAISTLARGSHKYVLFGIVVCASVFASFYGVSVTTIEEHRNFSFSQGFMPLVVKGKPSNNHLSPNKVTAVIRFLLETEKEIGIHYPSLGERAAPTFLPIEDCTKKNVSFCE